MSTELRRISFFDTTLRDGEQAPGNGMTPEQKLELGLLIEGLGVDVIETGFPASSPSDFRATELLSERLTTARFCTFVRAVRRDVEIAVSAGGTTRHQVQLLATGSEMHLEHKRGISRAEGIREATDTVAFARGLGITDISIGLEDATRGSDDYLRCLIESTVDAGATTLVVADTCGCHLPGEFGDLIAKIREWAPRPAVITTHCHNDLGLAVANTLAGIQAGADEVQTTLAGIGERAGNAAMEEIVAALVYKGDVLGATTTVDAARMYAAYQVMARAIGMQTPRNKAVFGDNAFATQAGLHQAGILRNPATYEYVEPEVFGREREMLVGRHSGRAVLRFLLEEIGVVAEDRLVDELYHEYVASRADGGCDELGQLRRKLQVRFGQPVATR